MAATSCRCFERWQRTSTSRYAPSLSLVPSAVTVRHRDWACVCGGGVCEQAKWGGACTCSEHGGCFPRPAGQPDENGVKVTVAAGTKETVDIDVGEGCTLVWDWQVVDKDVGFSIAFTAKGGAPVEVVPSARMSKHGGRYVILQCRRQYRYVSHRLRPLTTPRVCDLPAVSMRHMVASRRSPSTTATRGAKLRRCSTPRKRWTRRRKGLQRTTARKTARQ